MSSAGRLFIAALLPLLTLNAQVRTLWQIGKFDHSPLEFSAAAQDNITYVVGKSDWKKNWPGAQDLKQPYKISFPLPAVAGSYVLRIATLIEQPRVPVLQIEVNGHSGTFYSRPTLSYFPGDASFAYHPNYSTSTIEARIPESLLKPGDNTITITPMDDPPAVPDEAQFSTVTYDALSLDHDASNPADPDGIYAQIVPTIFYQKTASGLAEIVEAFIGANRAMEAGEADLEIAGQIYHAKLAAREFGEQRISFEVPEWNGTVAAKLHVSAGTPHTFEASLTAARKWTIFVVPHTHLDVGYTDYQGKVAEMQPRVLMQAANLIHEHPDFRFSTDASWNLEQFLNTRPESKQKEILDLIRAGKIGLPAQYCNLLTGYASLETLYRSLYPSMDFADRYGLPFEYANITDVPTYSGSYPSVLAASGVKYWVAAANNDRAPIFYHEHWNERSPFWWEGPDGKKVLFWYSWAYLQTQTLFGLPPSLNAVRESLPIFLQAYSKPAYKLDIALIYGTQVENTDLFPSTATFATDWNQSYAFPKLQYATFPDFFHYVEDHFGKDLPTYRQDGGPYWEDGIGSDAAAAAQDRMNQNRALSAEVLSTTMHSVDPNLNAPKGAFTDIWRNIILFAEHTWLSYNSITQPDHEESVKQLRVKDSRAQEASLEIEDVMNRSLSQLADRIHIPANTLVVFNSLNWKRDAMVETDLFEHPALIDLTTKQTVPLQILYAKEKFLHVRFLATELPPVGYKCFSVSYGKESGPSETPVSRTAIVENLFYRLTVDPGSGALSGLYDKQLRRELVDVHSPYKFGQYLYVTGGANTQLINPYPSLPPATLAVHPASNGRLVSVEQLPWGYSIRTTSSSVNTPVIQGEILLFNDQKKVEFRYHIQKKYTTEKEAVYIAFPAAVQAPAFAFSSQQGWVDPAHDLMKGGSLEWFTVQDWMSVHDSNLALGIVPLDASLASFGDINRGRWNGDFKPQTGTIFSYAMNNYWDTNYRAGQGGDFTFRYAVASGPKLDPEELTRLGMEEMRPAELDYVVSQDKAGNPPRPLPPTGTGFLETNSDDVALISWKQAESGQGTILRLAETAGHESQTTVRLPHSNIASAQLCSGVEKDEGGLPVTNGTVKLHFRPFEVLTVRLVIGMGS